MKFEIEIEDEDEVNVCNAGFFVLSVSARLIHNIDRVVSFVAVQLLLFVRFPQFSIPKLTTSKGHDQATVSAASEQQSDRSDRATFRSTHQQCPTVCSPIID